jgi:rare lipoprotein A
MAVLRDFHNPAVPICSALFCSNFAAQILKASVESVRHTETGFASYYSDTFQGRRTASGERYNKNSLTAAHKRYPFGTRLRITNMKNNKSVIVRVNDRGPTRRGRIVDVSKRAAEILGFVKVCLAKVKVEVNHIPRKKTNRMDVSREMSNQSN